MFAPQRHAAITYCALAFCALGLLIATLSYPHAAKAKPEKGKMYDDWGIECETDENKVEKCFVSQNQVMKDNKGRLLKVSIGYIGPKSEPTMVAMLPLGISIPAGAIYKVDDSKTEIKLALQSCTPEGCAAMVRLDDAMLKSLLTAKTLTIGVMPATGNAKTIAMPVSLKGFPAAFGTLK